MAEASSNPNEGGAKPKFCANCLSKMEMLDIRPLGVYCQCSNCQSESFSVCGACRMVPYCSKACQKEHWKYNHKARCSKIVFGMTMKMAGIPMLRPGTTPDNARARSRSTRSMEEKLVLQTEHLVDCYYWALFKSDRGMLDREPQDRQIDEEGPACPLNTSGDKQLHGWIAEYLGFLSCIVSALLVKDEQNRHLAKILDHVTLLRAVYFFHLSLEKDRKVTELKFAVLAFGLLSYDLSRPGADPIESFDSTVRSRSDHETLLVWETFIFHLSKLYKRLRMVKYKFINMESLKEKKPRKCLALEPFYNNGQRLLAAVSVSRTPAGDWYLGKNRATLPARTACVGCQTDLGGRTAQLLLSQPRSQVWAEDFSLTRVAATPCVLEMSNLPSPIVTCGRQETCNSKAKQLHLQFLREEKKALLDVLAECWICSGCSKYSLKTHKCSRCRSARYCSQLCLSQDWKFHRVRCEEQELTSSASKRLRGEAKMEHRRDLLQRLVFYDPVIGAAMTAQSAGDQ